MQKTKLSNGVTILTEQLPFFKMAHLQIRFTVGSGMEKPEEWGSAHFLEHLTFAGMNDESGLGFAANMADYGAIFNARTAMDHTLYQFDVPYQNLIPVLRLFLQRMTHEAMNANRVEMERDVILAELEMVEEDLFEFGLGNFYKHILQDNYGHPVIGTLESIMGLTPESLQAFRERYYTPDNLIIGIAGNVAHDEVVLEIQQVLGQWRGKSDTKCQPVLRETFAPVHVQTESEVVHLLWGLAGPSRKDRDGSAFAVTMKGLAGDGTDMWARLFHLIRTQLGIAYAVGGEYIYIDEVGLYFFTVVTQPEHVEKITQLVDQEFNDCQQGLSSLERSRAIATLASAVYSADDHLPSRVTRMLEQEIYEQPFSTVEEECALLEQTTEADVLRVTKRYLQPRLLMVLGPSMKVAMEEEVGI